MPLPNITGEIIAQGYNCFVRIGTNPTDAENIALVASFQATEDFQVQEAICIGNLGPVALDPQGYSCSITIDGFLPFKRTLSNNIQYPDSGKKALIEHVFSREQIMEGGFFKHKIVYMDFYNKKADKILAAFEGVIIASSGVSVEGNAYARNNVQAKALSWIKKE
jgi:hypothetical protein